MTIVEADFPFLFSSVVSDLGCCARASPVLKLVSSLPISVRE
jgi:hypothetical protein